MRNYAILSDIHANLAALDAVAARISELERAWGEPIRTLLNGDLLDAGPRPIETWDALQRMSDVFILGNHEDYLFEYARSPSLPKYSDPLWRFIPWTVSRFGRERVRGMEKRFAFSWQDPSGQLQLVHGSHDSNARVPDFFGGQNGPQAVHPEPVRISGKKIICAGHSHYLGLHEQPGAPVVWVNSGSVGYPFLLKRESDSDTPFATFVTVRLSGTGEGGTDVGSGERIVQFHAVAYSRERLIEDYMSTGALEECMPYSASILAQSLYNADINYPFFKEARRRGLTQGGLSSALMEHLAVTGFLERLAESFARSGWDGPACLRGRN